MKKYYLGIIFLLLILTTGCKKSIIGKWKVMDDKDEYYYIFNGDNTCSYEMKVARLDCTYKIDNNKIIIKYKGNSKANSFIYKLDGNTLIIKDDTGKNNKFTRVKRTVENK